jgi:hypothetical protein
MKPLTISQKRQRPNRDHASPPNRTFFPQGYNSRQSSRLGQCEAGGVEQQMTVQLVNIYAKASPGYARGCAESSLEISMATAAGYRISTRTSPPFVALIVLASISLIEGEFEDEGWAGAETNHCLLSVAGWIRDMISSRSACITPPQSRSRSMSFL